MHVSLWRRLAAILYDSFLLLAVLFIATALLLPLTGGVAIESGNPFYIAYLLIICYFFFAWFWCHGGQTLGMRAWKIKLQAHSGESVSWLRATLRFLIALLSWAALGLGFIWQLFDRQGWTWHDRWSNTMLIRIKKDERKD